MLWFPSRDTGLPAPNVSTADKLIRLFAAAPVPSARSVQLIGTSQNQLEGLNGANDRKDNRGGCEVLRLRGGAREGNLSGNGHGPDVDVRRPGDGQVSAPAHNDMPSSHASLDQSLQAPSRVLSAFVVEQVRVARGAKHD